MLTYDVLLLNVTFYKAQLITIIPIKFYDPDVGVQGYLKLSVSVIGPKDKMVIHDEDEDEQKEKEQDATNGGDISGLVLMPPTIKREWRYIVVSVYRAEYLPVMDRKVGTGPLVMSDSGIDAFFQVEFGGAKPEPTKVVTVKGRRSELNPIFNYELWYPVSLPTMTQLIKCSMWDNDDLTNELVAVCYKRFNEINSRGQTGLHWVNFYGATVVKVITSLILARALVYHVC